MPESDLDSFLNSLPDDKPAVPRRFADGVMRVAETSDEAQLRSSPRSQPKKGISGATWGIIVCVLIAAGCGVALAMQKPTVVSQQEYQQLRNWQTISEVNRIIGQQGELLTEATALGMEAKIYRWQNSEQSFLVCTFENGRLTLKSQTNLPERK